MVLVKRSLVVSIFAFFFLIHSFNFCYGQDDHDLGHVHEHSHNYEMSLAAGIVSLPGDEWMSFGLHIHLVRTAGNSKWLGIGLAGEFIFDEHMHISIGPIAEFRVYKGLVFSYSPGLLIIKEEQENDLQFSQHFETAYEFELGSFHVGPAAGIGIAKEGMHIFGGVHLGIHF